MSNLENKIIENVKKIISQKINESIELITEKWSISDEVDNFSDKILKDILLDIPNAKQEFIDEGLLFVSNIINNYSIYPIATIVNPSFSESGCIFTSILCSLASVPLNKTLASQLFHPPSAPPS